MSGFDPDDEFGDDACGYDEEDDDGPQACDLTDDDEFDVVTCPSCGAEISELAEQCPRCGEWLASGGSSRKSAVFIVLAVLLLLSFLIWVL